VKFNSDVQVSTIPSSIAPAPWPKDLKMKAPVSLKTDLGTFMTSSMATESVNVSTSVPLCEGILSPLSHLSFLSELMEFFATTCVPAAPAPVITPVLSSSPLTSSHEATASAGEEVPYYSNITTQLPVFPPAPQPLTF
jgi:hypothetical protein